MPMNERGRLGGLATKKRYGISHFSLLGKRAMKIRYGKKLSTLTLNEQVANIKK